MMLKKALTHKLTSRVHSGFPHSNAIFEGKIAQLWTLVKLTIFIVVIPNFGIVYFHVMWKKILLHGHLK